jgi:hypothetical protein
MGNMERRKTKRNDSRLEARFFCLGMFVSGTVTNLSEKGMFLHSTICFPVGSPLEIFVQSKKKILKIPIRVTRIEKENAVYKGMGVQISTLPRQYLALLIQQSLGI